MRCKLFKHYDELHKVIFKENKGTVVKLKKVYQQEILNKRINSTNGNSSLIGLGCFN